MPEGRWCVWAEAATALIAFGLPLTLLWPNFSLWTVIPKIEVQRFHLIAQKLTWPQINTAMTSLIVFFFSLYLEIRKRNLDDMVEKVLSVTKATDATLEEEKDQRTAAVRAHVELLDASAEHYENLLLLSDDLSKTKRIKKQHPPSIELSMSPEVSVQ